MLERVKILQIKQFTFQQSKKVFNHCVVQTITPMAHALLDTIFFEHSLISSVLIVPTLARMEDEVCAVWYLCKSLFQHFCYHWQHRMLINCVAYDITTKQIENGRLVQFLPKQAKLRHICDPLQIRLSIFMEVRISPLYYSIIQISPEQPSLGRCQVGIWGFLGSTKCGVDWLLVRAYAEFVKMVLSPNTVNKVWISGVWLGK